MIIGSPNNFHIQKITSRVWLWTAKTSNGLTPLHLRILVDGKKTEISLGIKISPKDWDERKQLVKRSNPSFELYNAQIREISTKFVNATLHLKTLETDFVIYQSLFHVPVYSCFDLRFEHESLLHWDKWSELFCRYLLPL